MAAVSLETTPAAPRGIWNATRSTDTAAADTGGDSNNRSQLPGGYALLQRDERLASLEIAVQSSVFCVAVSSNGLVFALLRFGGAGAGGGGGGGVGARRRRRKLSQMHLMVAHLATADVFVAVFNVLPQLVWDATGGVFRGNDALCRAVAYLQLVAMFASSYVLLATAVDRYNAICRPILSHTRSTTRSRSLVAVAWVLSLAFAVPQVRDGNNGAPKVKQIGLITPLNNNKIQITLQQGGGFRDNSTTDFRSTTTC